MATSRKAPATPTWPALSLNVSALTEAVEGNTARIHELRQKNAELGHLLEAAARASTPPDIAPSEEVAAPAGVLPVQKPGP